MISPSNQNVSNKFETQENLRVWTEQRKRSATNDAKLLEQLQRLHELLTPPAAIAKRLNIAASIVPFTIQPSRFPQRQMMLGLPAEESDR